MARHERALRRQGRPGRGGGLERQSGLFVSIKEAVLYCCAGLIEGPDEVFAMVSAVVMQDIGTGGDSCLILHVAAGAVDQLSLIHI